VEKQALFATSDVISLHLVLSSRTRHVVDAAALAAMKPTAFLVNTSRAGLVDQKALFAALREDRLAGAGLDVYETEPLPADDPVRSTDKVVLTPHLGYVSEPNFRDFYINAVEAVKAWEAGKPIRVLS
jgi:phosphoglycerate dehydrogenase-like enzyme